MTSSPSTSSVQAVSSHPGLTCWLRPGIRGKKTAWIQWTMISYPGITSRFTPTSRSTSAPRQACTRPKKSLLHSWLTAFLWIPEAQVLMLMPHCLQTTSHTCTWPVNSRNIMPLLHHTPSVSSVTAVPSSGPMILCPFSSFSPKFDIMILCSLVHFISQDAAETSTGPHTDRFTDSVTGHSAGRMCFLTDRLFIYPLCPWAPFKNLCCLRIKLHSLLTFLLWWLKRSFGCPWLTCRTGWGRVLGGVKLVFCHVMEIVEQADVVHEQHCLLHYSVSLVHFLFGKLVLWLCTVLLYRRVDWYFIYLPFRVFQSELATLVVITTLHIQMFSSFSVFFFFIPELS